MDDQRSSREWVSRADYPNQEIEMNAHFEKLLQQNVSLTTKFKDTDEYCKEIEKCIRGEEFGHKLFQSFQKKGPMIDINEFNRIFQLLGPVMLDLIWVTRGLDWGNFATLQKHRDPNGFKKIISETKLTNVFVDRKMRNPWGLEVVQKISMRVGEGKYFLVIESTNTTEPPELTYFDHDYIIYLGVTPRMVSWMKFKKAIGI